MSRPARSKDGAVQIPLSYSNGFHLGQTRRICKAIFKSFFYRADKDLDNMVYVIRVKKTLIEPTTKEVLKVEDWVDIQDFIATWCTGMGKGWILKMVSDEDVKAEED